MNKFIIALAAPLALAACQKKTDQQARTASAPPPTSAPASDATVLSPSGTPTTPSTDISMTTPSMDTPASPAVPPPSVPAGSPGNLPETASANRDNVTPWGATATPSPAGAGENSFAIAEMHGSDGAKINGTVRFSALSAEPGADVRIVANFADAPAGEHGIHIHEKGDCSAFASGSAGSHWNPAGTEHGGPNGEPRHGGDLGNIVIDANGAGMLSTTLKAPTGLASVLRPTLLGKAVILHASVDDLKSQPAGNSGTPIACGVIKESGTAAAH